MNSFHIHGGLPARALALLFCFVAAACGRQSPLDPEKWTMDRIRRVADAMELFAEENRTFPLVTPLLTADKALIKGRKGDRRLSWVPPNAWPVLPTQRVELLRNSLQPRFIEDLPTNDAWGHPLLCAITIDGVGYTLLSTGADGLIDSEHTDSWPSEHEWRDIVYDEVWRFSSCPSGVTRAYFEPSRQRNTTMPGTLIGSIRPGPPNPSLQRTRYARR